MAISLGGAISLLLLLLLTGCSETVGFVTLELLAPDFSPDIVCAKDPRRAAEVTVSATCGDETHERTAKVDGKGFSLGDLPLGKCTVDVVARNEQGRTVLSGTASAEVGRGDNDPVELQLVEERCVTASCDGDGDTLADEDETAIGTDPAKVDSDGDGLEDGLELLQCCTDPTRAEGQCRELFVQRVEPGMGPPGTAVMVKASSPLDSPQVTVGGQPLQNLLADSTIAFGTVAAGAKLGEVELSTGGGTVSYDHLFAVLRDTPESLAEISNRAAGVGPVIYQLVDQAFDGGRQYLLGRSFVGSSASAAVVPMLLLLDHQNQTAYREAVALKGEPVAIAAAAGRALVLLDVDGNAALQLYAPTGPAAGLPQKVSFSANLPLDGPVELALEPAGDTALLLLRERLLRFKLDSSGKATLVWALQLGKLVGPLGPTACEGLVYRGRPGKETVYLSCNASIPCPPGLSCDAGGFLLRVPLGCAPAAGCASVHLLGLHSARGNPVVDEASGRVYVLGSAGVQWGALDSPPKLLSTLVPMQWSGAPGAADLMAVVGPSLFVVDGPQVWRMDPTAADPAQRRGKAFVVSRGTDQAQMVRAAPDGATLSVAVQVNGGFTSMIAVCLEACGK